MPLSFRIGLVIGFIVAFATYTPGMMLKYPLEVSVEGDEIARRGAATVTVSEHSMLFRQTCSETCDDLNIKFRHTDEPEGATVSIRGADGRVILQSSSYVDGFSATHAIYK